MSPPLTIDGYSNTLLQSVPLGQIILFQRSSAPSAPLRWIFSRFTRRFESMRRMDKEKKPNAEALRGLRIAEKEN
jgi:hypothetical protein